jgi:hypothetical protein
MENYRIGHDSRLASGNQNIMNLAAGQSLNAEAIR